MDSQNLRRRAEEALAKAQKAMSEAERAEWIVLAASYLSLARRQEIAADIEQAPAQLVAI